MTREILTNAQAQPVTVTGGDALKSPQAPSTVTPSKPVTQDALAGAFPDWDLLPTTQFVRRVK